MLCKKVWGFVKRHSTVSGVLIVFAATYVLMLAVHAGETGAAWIQAFGSIGAILAATYIAHQDRRAVRQQEQKKEVVLCLAISIHVQDARGMLKNLSVKCMHAYNEQRYLIAHEISQIEKTLDKCAGELRAIDPLMLQDPNTFNTYISAVRIVEAMRDMCADSVVLNRYNMLYRGELFNAQLEILDHCIGVFKKVSGS